MNRCVSIAWALACALLSSQPAQAADKPGSKDYPSISRFAGAEIRDYQVLDFDEAFLPVKPIEDSFPPADALLKIEGRVLRTGYEIANGKTSLEVMRNYEQALARDTVLFRCAGIACGSNLAAYLGNSGKLIPSGWSAGFDTLTNRYLLVKRSAPSGDVYVLVYVMQESNSNPLKVFQQVVEVKAMQTGQVTVLDAAALKRGLDTDGKVAVYGVYFDTAKADVKPESKPSLDEMAKLLTTQKALKVYIVGHTDNAGTLAANLELSQRRAEAVAKALATTYKIDAARLVARGVASLAPVATNSDEAGRARNRRVELVVQ